MTRTLSPNTQAILLLTAPLIAGRGGASPDLLSPGEYKRLARHLRELQRQPSDMLTPDAFGLLRECQSVIDEARLQRLLGRGFLLSQVLERWQARAIWVVSRADTDYPQRLKARLREDSPAVLYGCGEMSLLETGGLAVVGSRNADEVLIEYTMKVGSLAARAGRTIVSGGAKGVDQAAMRGALEAGGRVSGVLADSLEGVAMNRVHRNLVIDGQLVLISPYDPSAGFNVGHAMQRNKLIYALAEAALVVSSDVEKGGTWAGAIEQLEKLRFAPIYVRSPSDGSKGLQALERNGAEPWPNPPDVESLDKLFEAVASATPPSEQLGLPLSGEQASLGATSADPIAPATASSAVLIARESPSPPYRSSEAEAEAGHDTPDQASNLTTGSVGGIALQPPSPSDTVFAAVRQAALSVLTVPTNDAEFATALDVSKAQARDWLKRLQQEGLVEKKRRPSGYVAKPSTLFD